MSWTLRKGFIFLPLVRTPFGRLWTCNTGSIFNRLAGEPFKYLWTFKTGLVIDFHAGLCWFGAGLAGGPAWWSWSTSKVPLIMLAYQHSLTGEVADEADHQHTITSVPCCCWYAVTSIKSPAFHAPSNSLRCDYKQGASYYMLTVSMFPLLVSCPWILVLPTKDS